MKYSASIYSYISSLKSGEMNVFDCITKTKELGFDSIELVDFIHFDCDFDEMSARAKSFKEYSDKAGLSISALAISADFINGSDGDTEKEIERVKKYVDICGHLGTKKMRHDITRGIDPKAGSPVSYDSLIPLLAESCRQVAEYAFERGVMTMTENHGYFSQDSERVEKLYNTVNHKNFSLLCDIGNFLCADEDPALATARVAPYSRHVHAKDFVSKSFYGSNPGEGAFPSRSGDHLIGTVIGHGNVPISQCLSILKNAGYNDTITIEFEGLVHPVTALRIGLDNLKKYWEAV